MRKIVKSRKLDNGRTAYILVYVSEELPRDAAARYIDTLVQQEFDFLNSLETWEAQSAAMGYTESQIEEMRQREQNSSLPPEST